MSSAIVPHHAHRPLRLTVESSCGSWPVWPDARKYHQVLIFRQHKHSAPRTCSNATAIGRWLNRRDSSIAQASTASGVCSISRAIDRVRTRAESTGTRIVCRASGFVGCHGEDLDDFSSTETSRSVR